MERLELVFQDALGVMPNEAIKKAGYAPAVGDIPGLL